MRQSLAAALLIAAALPAAVYANHHETMTVDPALKAAVAAPTRSEANRARDPYRHPAETLAFFGVKPNHVVVEALPGGGGWYTEILAPYLAERGTLYLAQPDGRGKNALKTKLDANAAAYGKAKWAAFPLTAETIPDGSADVVLTFRNVHNLTMNGGPAADNAFASFYRALKPGGVLGIVEHRLPESRDTAQEKTSGYLKRSTVVALAEKAGFKLAGESEVNANPKDTADYPQGVWTLPPNYREGDKDRAKYAAIGESDRMTLKFVKPKG